MMMVLYLIDIFQGGGPTTQQIQRVFKWVERSAAPRLGDEVNPKSLWNYDRNLTGIMTRRHWVYHGFTSYIFSYRTNCVLGLTTTTTTQQLQLQLQQQQLQQQLLQLQLQNTYSYNYMTGNYTTLIILHHNYNSTTLQLQLQLQYITLHPSSCG